MSAININNKAAKTVNRRVTTYKILKLLFPAVAGLLLGVVLLWPTISEFFAPKPQIIVGRSINIADAPKDESSALKPQYEGVDKKGRPYKLSAHKGINVAPGVINLEHPNAFQELKNGQNIILTALKGTVFEDEKRLILVGSVTLNHSKGIDFTSESATILYSEGKAEGEEPIHGTGQGFNIKAGAFRVYDNGDHIVFYNNPILTLEK